jgi:serine/threonine protein kinase
VGEGTEQASVRVVGRYALYGEIASGGMATVHFGRLLGPVGFSRTVAIKRLHPQFAKDPEFVSMFLDEARVAARIRHPNVVPTLDVVATDGELFLVMDYVEGESLGRLVRALKAQGMTPPGTIVASVISGVLHGLHAAHEARNERGAPLGIVHRDVSPQNVLVGTDGVARVLDFGVAKATGRLQTTREGQIKGKLAYMPPEQLRGAPLSRTTDIYAASVVLWEALTGQRLFVGDNEGAIFAKILEAPVAPPSKVVPGLTEAFDAVTLRGLSRDVSERFATAREMALALERCTPLAPPSEVGQWVENLAKSVLTLRSERVAEIESSSSVKLLAGGFDEAVSRSESSAHFMDGVRSSPGAQPSSPSSPRGVAGLIGGETTASQLSLLSVSKSGAGFEKDSRRKKIVLGSVAVGALVVGMCVWRLAAAPASLASSTSSTLPSSQPSAEAPAAGSTLDPAVPALDAPKPPASAAPPTTAAGSSVASAPAPPVLRRAPVHLPSRPPSSSVPKDCDPPYTLDAEGHKHYKLNCL